MTISVPPFREHYYTSQDGLRLFYREYGDPLSSHTPLLCLSGLARNADDFNVLALRHSATRWVICPDYRGHGRSQYDPDWRGYSGPTFINDIRHLLACAGIERAAVVGTSMGGLLAMGLGVAAPMVLAGIILNDTAPQLEPRGLKRILELISKDRPQPDWATAIARLQKELPFLSFKTDDEWRCFAEVTYRENDDGQLHFNWDPGIAKPLLKSPNPGPDLWRYFQSVRHVPLLLIRGALSDVVSEQTMARMAAEHDDMRNVTVPNVGHAPSLNEPEAATAIDEFLTRF